MPDPVPRDEPLHPRANRAYAALGSRYEPMTRREPFRQAGIASWYGRRYHGNATSSGGPYDMYAMTAAHPTLPLPSWVRVTNRDNGRSVVVRVNDRGPFLNGRIIDLSYLAAYKLGYVDAGSAPVDVEALLPGVTPNQVPSVMASAVPAPTDASAPAVGHYLQLGAYRSKDGAIMAADELRSSPELGQTTLMVVAEGGLFRVKAGPWAQREAALAVADLFAGRTGKRPLLIAPP